MRPYPCFRRATDESDSRHGRRSPTTSSSFKHQSHAPQLRGRTFLRNIRRGPVAGSVPPAYRCISASSVRRSASSRRWPEHLPPATKRPSRSARIRPAGRRGPRGPICRSARPTSAPACTTNRTFDRSMPMPNATVATTMSARSRERPPDARPHGVRKAGVIRHTRCPRRRATRQRFHLPPREAVMMPALPS